MVKGFEAAILVAGLFASSCIAPTVSGRKTQVPNARAPDAPDAPETGEPLVNISGPIEYIDGKPARRTGAHFQVRPGCHVLRTDTNFVTSTDQATIRGTIEPAHFVLHTRAGYDYYVDRQFLDNRVRMIAHERGPSGNVVQSFGPTDDGAQIKACQEQAPL